MLHEHLHEVSASPAPTRPRAPDPASPRAWNWEPGRRTVATLRGAPASLGHDEPTAQHAPVISADGEHVAAAVALGQDSFRIRIDDRCWETPFEKVLSPRFLADGRLVAAVRIDDAWTIAVDDAPWDERFDFLWNVRTSPDGRSIAAQIKRGVDYGLVLDGVPWERGFLSIREFRFSPDGRHLAAPVQVAPLSEADTLGFLEGTWSVAVDGEPWDARFVNAYGPAFAGDGRVAAAVRTAPFDYAVAEDGRAWSRRDRCVWEPLYTAAGGAPLAPVRRDGGWSLARGGELFWQRTYAQLWRVAASADGEHVAAVVAPTHGRWTVAVDDRPWKATFSDVVLDPMFSPDGSRVAAVVRDRGAWSVAVDGRVWPGRYEMAWSPVFSPDGTTVAAHVEREGRHVCVVDGAGGREPSFDRLWDPVFSPNGGLLLLRGERDGQVVREVLPVATARG